MLRGRPSPCSLRNALAIAAALMPSACGIPWANLQNGRVDGAHDVFADAQADVFDGGTVDVAPSDAADLVADDTPTDGVVSIDTPSIDIVTTGDVVDTTSLPDIVDTFDASDATDVRDVSDVVSSDVQASCYGVGGDCSPIAPCCNGLSCGPGGTCRSSCLTAYASCTTGGCCAGMNCQFNFCIPNTCRDLHQTCSAPDACCTGLTCVAGSCQCAIGETACTVATIHYCANLQVNSSNCGSCGHRCVVGQTCMGGSCI